ncbi:hypothetical protein BIW11_04459 [Tropilaelaps mercedesae]|uniref:Uncharacterized protein n=1 Tax=Tropilaelaps mercedesae TaxID=418985 RepID=A0A1V9X6V8_9ACAR|nr:hypothetical protein BIW11_04459 [Tropilaelaps mercedesae]
MVVKCSIRLLIQATDPLGVARLRAAKAKCPGDNAAVDVTLSQELHSSWQTSLPSAIAVRANASTCAVHSDSLWHYRGPTPTPFFKAAVASRATGKPAPLLRNCPMLLGQARPLIQIRVVTNKTLDEASNEADGETEEINRQKIPPVVAHLSRRRLLPAFCGIPAQASVVGYTGSAGEVGGMLEKMLTQLHQPSATAMPSEHCARTHLISAWLRMKVIGARRIDTVIPAFGVAEERRPVVHEVIREDHHDHIHKPCTVCQPDYGRKTYYTTYTHYTTVLDNHGHPSVSTRYETYTDIFTGIRPTRTRYAREATQGQSRYF